MLLTSFTLLRSNIVSSVGEGGAGSGGVKSGGERVGIVEGSGEVGCNVVVKAAVSKKRVNSSSVVGIVLVGVGFGCVIKGVNTSKSVVGERTIISAGCVVGAVGVGGIAVVVVVGVVVVTNRGGGTNFSNSAV